MHARYHVGAHHHHYHHHIIIIILYIFGLDTHLPVYHNHGNIIWVSTVVRKYYYELLHALQVRT